MKTFTRTAAFAAVAAFAVAAPLAQHVSAQSFAIGISIRTAPPALPVYVQPPCPQPGYMWTPGYWAWGQEGYYWVPGVWVAPPRVGLLWTPGYWGYNGGVYVWNAGYWGPHVGFYGGVNYGFGYGGVGFGGGMWSGGVFRYNTAVMNVNTTVIHNTYIDRTVINNTVVNRTSFNGPGGIAARPTPQQMAFSREQHFGATVNQQQHQNFASQDRNAFARFNGGRPQTVAMTNVGGARFGAQGRPTGAPAMSPGVRPGGPASAAPVQRGFANNTVNNREVNQQQRIANGIDSGRMSSGEAARAENRQQSIDRQVRQDRAENGGRMTAPERQQVNREQNAASRQISRENHNEAHGPRR